MRFHHLLMADYLGAGDDYLSPCLCSFSSSRSKSSQSTQVTDQRVGASGGSIAASSGASIRIETLSDEALGELVGLGELTIKEGVALAGRGLDGALDIQAESLRLVNDVILREQEPGTEATRAALIAVVAVIGLVFAVPAIFKKA